MNINEFLAVLENVRIDVDNKNAVIKNGIKYLPIYIILYANKSLLGDAIRAFTKEPYSHASISFDTSMNNIYTFGNRIIKGRGQNNEKTVFGASIESFKTKSMRFSYDSKTKYGLYVMFLQEENVEKMKYQIRKIFNNGDLYKYSISGLVKYALGQPSESETKMFCSQFVSWILSYGGVQLEKYPSLYSPYQLTQLENVIFIETGTIKDYNRNRINQKMEIIKNNFISQ